MNKRAEKTMSEWSRLPTKLLGQATGLPAITVGAGQQPEVSGTLTNNVDKCHEFPILAGTLQVTNACGRGI